VKKGKRNPLVPNSLKRIAGGIKKYAPELNFIFQYYGNGLNAQTIDSPLNTITTKDRHVLVTIDKKHFVADHCYSDNYNTPEDPLNPILTRETKQLITVEKLQFLSDYYGRENTAHSLDGPSNTITTQNSKHLVTINKNQFIAAQYNSNGNPEANTKSIDDPLNSVTTEEKMQFITAYFSSSGNQHSQNQSIEQPLNTITTSGTHHALVSAFTNGNIDFDIKMRFLDPEELAQISSFPKGYFTNKQLGLSRKQQTKLIGNAVPSEWARLIIQPMVKTLNELISCRKQAV
jgi:site-specific DNA-cytosine methylase